jgi:hypothetical protein
MEIRMADDSSFVPGLERCRSSCAEVLAPLIDRRVPGLVHS